MHRIILAIIMMLLCEQAQAGIDADDFIRKDRGQRETILANRAVRSLVSEALAPYASLCNLGCPVQDGDTEWGFKSGAGGLFVIIYPNYRGDGYVHVAIVTILEEKVLPEGLKPPFMALMKAFAFPLGTNPFTEVDQRNVDIEYKAEGSDTIGLYWKGFPEKGADVSRLSQWIFDVVMPFAPAR